MMMMMNLVPKMIVHVVVMVHESLAKSEALVLTGKINLNLNILILTLNDLPVFYFYLPDKLLLLDELPDKLHE